MQAAVADINTCVVSQVSTFSDASGLTELPANQMWITDAQWSVAPTVGQIWNSAIPASFADPLPMQSMTPLQFIAALGNVAPTLWTLAGSSASITQWMVQGMTAGIILRSVAVPAMQQLETAGTIPAGTTAAVWG